MLLLSPEVVFPFPRSTIGPEAQFITTQISLVASILDAMAIVLVFFSNLYFLETEVEKKSIQRWRCSS